MSLVAKVWMHTSVIFQVLYLITRYGIDETSKRVDKELAEAQLEALKALKRLKRCRQSVTK